MEMPREEAFKGLKENICAMCAYGSQNMDTCDIRACDNRDYIKALEQEPKTGHWIKYGIPRCGEQHYQCSLCGYYINFGQWGKLYTKEFKFCPACGKRLNGSQESEG